MNIARHLLSQERLPFTATYFGSIALTIYFAIGVCSRRLITNPSPFPPSTSRHHHRISLTIQPNPASKYPPHPPLLHRPDRRARLVPRQLLPHGLAGAAVRGEVRGKSCCGLDQRVSAVGICEPSCVYILPINHLNISIHVFFCPVSRLCDEYVPMLSSVVSRRYCPRSQCCGFKLSPKI